MSVTMEDPGEQSTVVFALILTEPEPVFVTFRGAQELIRSQAESIPDLLKR
jgi:hypothetical protein